MTKSEYEKYRKAKQEARRWKKKWIELKKETESKKGHWIDNYGFKCSECNKYAFSDEWGYFLSKYCPNCGCLLNEVSE